MELSDEKVLETLLQSWEREQIKKAGRPAGARKRPVLPESAPRAARRRCRCAKCGTCLDEARWERIFQEKFADPDYYTPKPIAFLSSLSR